ncbi:Sec39 domain-containing protein [Tirmania nivea]|nr:Sec39 domain-containing protein [Tirmania nivea]
MAGSTSLYALSPAHVLLLAINFASASDLESFISLKCLHPKVLTPAVTLTILLFLPESLQPSTYVPILDSILGGPEAYSTGTDKNSLKQVEVDTSSVADLSEKIVQAKVERLLSVVPTLSSGDNGMGHQELVSEWLQIRARNIDTETGMLSLVESLLSPFVEKLKKVDAYYNGTVKVLSRLVYEYDKSVESSIGEESRDEETVRKLTRGLIQFEALPVSSGVKQLLSRTSNDTVIRDIITLIIPYLCYRDTNTKMQGWRVVWEWLVSQDLRMNYEAFTNWGGPQGCGEGEDILMRQYSSTGMAACYLCKEVGEDIWAMMDKIQKRIVEVLGQWNLQPPISQKFERDLYAGHLKPKPTTSELLSRDNKLTTPTLESLDLLGYLIYAAHLLSLPLYFTARIRISGTKDEQKAVLVRYVRSGNWMKRTDAEWIKIVEAARWLRVPAGVFEQLTEQNLEEVLARGLMSAAKFKIVEDIYVKDPAHRGVLGVKKLEEVIIDAFQEFYDNASNGNMTRGGMKDAQLALQVLYPAYSKSPALTRAFRLLNATHALSFYSLTLTPGVPLLPVQVRINPDPLSLLGRLLDQNPALYLQQDKLVPLAKDLYFGTAPTKPRSIVEEQHEEGEVERRVLGMCIETAIAEDDFDTAYSLTKSRLKTPEGNSISQKDGDGDQHDESAWKACFQAGRYRSHQPPRREDDALKRLEMQMELLAEALRSCPAVACNQVLSEWMRKEDEMASLLLKEAEEDEAHAAAALRGSSVKPSMIGVLPGGWNSSTSLQYGRQEKRMTGTMVGESEAPMGLFAVAAGAAKALSSSVRPLGVPRSNASAKEQGRPMVGTPSPPPSPASMGGSPPQRQRKRDILTSGLASGLGWVLGAQPTAGDGK